MSKRIAIPIMIVIILIGFHVLGPRSLVRMVEYQAVHYLFHSLFYHHGRY